MIRSRQKNGSSLILLGGEGAKPENLGFATLFGVVLRLSLGDELLVNAHKPEAGLKKLS